MKNIVKGIIGTILGIVYVYFCINGYPSEWIVHGSFLSMGTPILRQLVNSCIFFFLYQILNPNDSCIKKSILGMINSKKKSNQKKNYPY